MKIPDEFSGRVLKLRSQSMFSDRTQVDNLLPEWLGSYTDVIYESHIIGYQHNISTTVVAVFETTEDAPAFRIKYGDKYV
jgi:hypothetical protein